MYRRDWCVYSLFMMSKMRNLIIYCLAAACGDCILFFFFLWVGQKRREKTEVRSTIDDWEWKSDLNCKIVMNLLGNDKRVLWYSFTVTSPEAIHLHYANMFALEGFSFNIFILYATYSLLNEWHPIITSCI